MGRRMARGMVAAKGARVDRGQEKATQRDRSKRNAGNVHCKAARLGG